jgi:ribonuclease D
VDIRTDHKLLYKQWLYIPPGKHLDLQDMLKIPGYGNRAGMATMASELIHPKYAGMKEKFVTDYDKFEGHNYWEWKPLSDMNLEYASIDGYVAYELARIVTIVNQGLHP